MMRKTKIICTIGPASHNEKTLKKLAAAGMDIARLNLSHGTYQDHAQTIKKIRKIDPKIAVLADLQGPRIRTGKLKHKTANLKTGEKINILAKQILGDEANISISPARVFADIKSGDTLFLADGSIRLRVLAKDRGKLRCRVEDGGVLGEHKGVNIPATKLSLPSLTAKDKQDARWARRQGVDYLGLSFVRQAKDVLALKKLLHSSVPVIAKIEKPEAVANIAEIINVSDGVMIARGDLGIELSLEKVPEVQKDIICLCQKHSKPVIVATQMLESMVSEEHPSRAEVSDVANAIFDGTDAVMLSEETSIGKFPVEAVATMARIALEAEDNTEYSLKDLWHHDNPDFHNEAVAHSAAILAEVVNAKAILTFTESGSTALRVSKERPRMPVYGIVKNLKALRKLALYYGVEPILAKSFRTVDSMIANAKQTIRKIAKLKKGDSVVITAGVPVNVPGTTNLIKVLKV